jgi:apolipoprotein D and lipocalin family protein
MIFRSTLIASLSTLFLSTSMLADQPLETVSYVDLDRYIGKWYEIARLEQRFQKGCINSTAEYSYRDDGDIRVVNRCELKNKDKIKEATGRAWVKDKETNAKLRVQFILTGIKLSFLSGKYWILDLAPDYSYAIVGDPSREYFWLLSRTPTMDDALLEKLMTKAEALGYTPEDFIFNQ